MKRGQIATAMALLCASATPAFAHHVMGGKTPETFWEGLLSGLGHPLIEIPHFAAIVVAGVVAARFARPSLIALFAAGSFLGTGALGLAFPLPLGETLVFGSIVVLALLLLAQTADLVLSAALFAIGAVHGMAFAESIIGAEASPLVAYLLGLALMESVIAGVAFALARRLGLPVRTRA